MLDKEELPLSAQLRKTAGILEGLGKQIEDLQVEDGDPPYLIERKPFQSLMMELGKTIAALSQVKVD